MPQGLKYIGKSHNYKHVYEYKEMNGTTVWATRLGKQRKNFTDEREAAKWVDLQLIRLGKDPVNVLKEIRSSHRPADRHKN